MSRLYNNSDKGGAGAPIKLDLAIIGAGPAGLAAGAMAKRLGIKDVVVFDRDERPGGILPQCIHPGFGLFRYGEELTGRNTHGGPSRKRRRKRSTWNSTPW